MTCTKKLTIAINLPGDVVCEIDRVEKDHGRFVLDAVRHKLDRRRGEELRRSIENPHCETVETAEAGFDEWARTLPQEDAADLRAPLRASESDGPLLAAIHEAIGRKPKGHDFVIDRRHRRPAVARHMSVTGG